jgi:hypothetical protein
VAPDQALVRRFVSVAASCPESVPKLLRRPVIRRLLMIMGIAVAGWLLGSAGHARAATLPAPAAPVAGALGQATHDSANTTLHDLAHTLPLRPGGVTTPLHALGVQSPVHISTPRGTGTTATKATTTRDYGTTKAAMAKTTMAKATVAKTHSPSASGSLRGTSRITRHGVAHRSHRRHAAGASGITRTAGHRGAPRPQPHQASSAGTSFGLHCGSRQGHVGHPPFITALIIGAVPPAVRTAADEPSFSPD